MMTKYTFFRWIFLVMLLLLTVGVNKTWAQNRVYPKTRMTYVDANNPTTSYSEIGWGSTAKAGWNYVGNDGGYPFVEMGNSGERCITFIEVDATQESNGTSINAGTIVKATLHAKISGTCDNQRQAVWAVGYNNESWWNNGLTFNDAYYPRHFIDLNNQLTTFTSSASVFEDRIFDITDAIKNDGDRKVILVVYETAEGGGYIKEPWVEITYNNQPDWNVGEFTMDLTWVNNNNQFDGMPKLYDINGNDITASATMSYSNSNVVGEGNYPPRLKGTGDCTVSANYGGNNYSYILHVTAPTVSGTYDAFNNKYSFNDVGVIITERTFTQVEGVTMTINGGPTSMVVNAIYGDISMTALKVIDEGGYSQPNLWKPDGDPERVVPWEGNRGGTWYKFVPSVDGHIYFEGHFDGAKWIDNGNDSQRYWSTKDFDVEAGHTYYLYNPNSGNPIPLLHSYRFEPDLDRSTLNFKNPNANISVEASEGSYTNEAISSLGLPVTYSITSGGQYANVNSSTGEVTFIKSQLASASFPLTITVQAQTNAWNGYPAATATYNLVLIKKTWIFDDNELWATTGSELSSNWTHNSSTNNYRNGTPHYELTKKLTNEPLTKDGTNEIPEFKGLRFTTDNATSRLDIAPKDESSNYLACVNTTIFIDDVLAGQTITIDWYSTRSSSVRIKDASGKYTDYQGSNTIASFTTTTAGTVEISIGAVATYIRSIKLSSPVRATGTLTYGKTLINVSDTENRTGYTIKDEATGADAKNYYYGPGAFQSSNTAVATVDDHGNVTAVGEGTVFITATASPKNSTTHQTVTMITVFEVTNSTYLSSATTRTRTINVEKLLYDVGENGKSANDGLDRTVPGFTLSFSGGQGVKCNYTGRLTLRNQDGSQGIMTITPRSLGNYVGIAKVKLSVSNLIGSPQITYNAYDGERTVSVTDGVLELDYIYASPLQIKAIQGSFDISEIKIYYTCETDVDNCLDETKVAPAFSFPAYKQHYMRVPGDNRVFENDKPVSSNPQCFRAEDFTYTSSNTRIATIGQDGTNGKLVASGEATITATFAETDYFAQSTTSYTASNTLLPGESYEGIEMTNGQFIHITAKASADNTTLTIENAANNLTYDTEQERQNTHVTGNVSVNLKNQTSEEITVYSYQIITPNVKAWLYYEGQEENFSAQVQFTGFPTGPIAGFKVFDFADMKNPIDLTDSYELTDGSVYAIQAKEGYALINPNGGTDETWNSGTGDANTPASGEAGGKSQISHGLTKKAGMADGYPSTLTALSDVTVMTFGPNNKVVWEFENQYDNTGASGEMGSQWNYTNPGTGREKFYQTYFSSFMPILKNGDVAKDNNAGILVSGDMRYYCGTSGLRLNLTTVNAHMKFPVKENMEVVIEVASSSADVTSKISNAKEVKAPYASTDELYILREGVNSPINAYYLAASDGCMIFDPGDKVGVYVKSITLQVPELHFDDEIVTELTGSSNRTVNYQPYNAIEGHTLTYTIRNNQSHSLDDDDGSSTIGTVAQINSNTTGDVEIMGRAEGWVTVDVVDNQATGVEPKYGSYRLYVVYLRFAQDTYNLTLDGNGEAYFSERPIGYDKLKTPIEYTMTLGEGSPRGRLMQYTNEDPTLTTYRMTAYSTGTITITATSGKATTSCNVVIGGLSFQYVAPAVSERELLDNNSTFNNPLPNGWSRSHSYTFDVSRSAYGDAVTCNTPTLQNVDGKDVLQLTGLSGHGAIRVIVTNTSLNQSARFVLTLAYPASSRKRWSFFRAKDHYGQWGLEIGTIANYVSYNDVGSSATGISKMIGGYNGTNSSDTWSTSSTWTEIFRKGAELPRWGNDRPQKGDNAFYVQETAGLQIESGEHGLYVDQPARDPNDKNAYNHIGIHNNASITIPKLKEGDYISLNLSRVIPNNGAIMTGYNITDLRGKPVTDEFTITRSQTDWSGLNDDGSRFIPGYYTFIAHDMRAANDPDKIAHPNEFSVTFDLLDEGYLDVLSVEIYDGGRYKHTMTDIKLKDQNVDAPNLLLKEEDDIEDFLLSYCHPLWSTSTGPCEYVFKGEQVNKTESYTTTEARYWVDADLTQKLKDDRKNLDVELDHVKWYSERGVEYEDGLLKVKSGYGKVVLRMNNYTVEGRYLIGYTPDYTLNVGVIPHKDYPHTWNFTNISGGEVKGQANNVYNNIKNDGGNWIGVEQGVYELNTDYLGASLYVPGGELVSTNRILGQRGENPVSYPKRGYDELNGLGVNGKIIIPVSPVQAASRQHIAPHRAAGDKEILLTYNVESTSITVNSEISAGDGSILFGSDSFEANAISSTNYSYRCGGGFYTYVKLTPKRAFEAGDIINIKAHSDNEHGGMSFWTSSTDITNPTPKQLVSLTLNEQNVEETLQYVVTQGDGVQGLSSIWVYNNGLTSCLNNVEITSNYMPDNMEYDLYAATETTLTLPDLNANGKQDWIYICADHAPTAITNATPVTENNDPDGPDANTGNFVYKYKVTDPGASYVTFAAGTNISQIGVTHILKEIHSVGGVGWATESRDHAIDHTLTGFFTVNDVDAFKVRYDSYDMETATVALTPVEENKGVPANTGMVLRELDATNLSKANTGKFVPLFYPAVSTSLVGGMDFSASGNMMYPNLTANTHTSETQTVEGTDYTKFILTNVHWKYEVESSWSKSGNSYVESRGGRWQDHGSPTLADAAGFYRLHIWENAADNTMAANTAYLLVPSDRLPVALWASGVSSGARVYNNSIGIRELGNDMTGMDGLQPNMSLEEMVQDNANDAWYTISGMKLDAPPTQPGLYIRGKKKVMVK